MTALHDPSVEALPGMLWSAAQVLMHKTERPEQTRLFLRALDRGDRGVVAMQGPTGVGKSMYAVPLLLRTNGGRVLYACSTKAQQNQVYGDIGAGLEAAGIGPSAVLFGRNEYYCRRRARENRGLVIEALARLGRPDWNWKPPPIRKTGVRVDYPELAEVWHLVNSNADDLCATKVCWGADAHTGAKSRARRARLLVVNHHLLVIAGGLGIPPYEPRESAPADVGEAVVIDEAHGLPDTLSTVFGATVTANRLRKAAGTVREVDGDVTGTWKERTDEWERIVLPRSDYDQEEFHGADVAADLAADALWMGTRLQHTADAMWVAADDEEGQQARARVQAAAGMMDRLRQDLNRLDARAAYAQWIEKPKPKAGYGRAVAQPLEVQEYAAALFDAHRSVTVMSATLAGFPATRLGIEQPDVLVGRSPFDLEHNRLGYYTPRVLEGDDWRAAQMDWPDEQACDELAELVRIAGGRTLILATSHKSKDRALERLCARGIDAIAQARTTSTVNALIARLENREVQALIGVDSLATGIDISGDALSMVIWLAWPNPETRTLWGRAVNRHLGGDREAWTKYWAPAAKLKTEQGIGRLIRTPTDRGVVALMDPRRRFKKIFGGLVAPSRAMNTLGAVRHHFAK